jgi:DNA topoisomerase-3
MAAVVLYDQALSGPPTATVESVVRRPTTKWRPLPLTTVELQKQGAKFLKMSSKKIMDIAEGLYTAGYISYPRTETDQFNEKIDLRVLIEKQTDDASWGQYSQSLLEGRYRPPRRGNHDDKAHPPIHPVIGVNREALRPDQLQVYDFITRHFLACCSDDAKGELTILSCDFNGEKFSTSGLVVKERNFLDVYPYWTWNTNNIPDFTPNEKLPVKECLLQEGKTTPPGYLTEPELIALMDANGIGTDATMAEHIEKIVERAYVIKHNLSGRKSLPVLIPSTLGVALVEGYDEIGFDKSLTKPFLRKDMEAAMKGICDGQMAKSDVIRTNLAMYREVFSIARRSESILVQAVCRYANNGPRETTTTTSATNASQSTRSRQARRSEVPV